MSKLLDLVLLSIAGTIIGIIVSILVIVKRIIDLYGTAKSKLNTLKRRNIKARKNFIDQLQRGNTCISTFFKQTNAFELRIPLKSLRLRTLLLLLPLPLAVVALMVFSIIVYNNLGISYIPIFPLAYLFYIAFNSLEDDFTVSKLKKNWNDYPFTALKRTISGIIFVLEQTITLTVFDLMIFLFLFLFIGPINTLNVLSKNVYPGVILIVLFIGLAILTIRMELNSKNELIIWAFSKFIKEEDAHLNLVVGLEKENVSGHIVGIGNNMELDLGDTYHREIPWSSIGSLSVAKNVKHAISEIEPIDDFFFKLKGKSIQIANYFRVKEDYNIGTTPELKDYVIDDWEITNHSGQRVLELITNMRDDEYLGGRLSMNSFADLVFIDNQNSKSYKIENIDLKNLSVEYKEIRS